MLEHTLTSHTLYFLYLAHSLATVTRQALSFQLLAHPFCRHRTKRSSLLSIVSGLFSVARRRTFSSPQKTACATADQRRVERSKSTETGSPSGGSIWTVEESEMKASAGKSNSRVAPVRKQGP